MLSELHPTKCVADAVRAMKVLTRTQPYALLVILGDGEERDSIERLIQELDIADSVAVKGFVPQGSTYLKAFDAFLHTSKSDALAYAVIEAGFAALPVVARRVGGIPEVIEDGKNGLLIDPNDNGAIAAALERLADSPELRRTLGEALRKKVREEFSLERMVAATQAVYDGRYASSPLAVK
jgi:glycosyltransferase involved in cell wall biosynthesis